MLIFFFSTDSRLDWSHSTDEIGFVVNKMKHVE